MAHFIIFSDGPGATLQWSGEAANAESAWHQIAADLGDPAAYKVREVTADERAEVEAWDDAGADAAEAPEWLDSRLQ